MMGKITLFIAISIYSTIILYLVRYNSRIEKEYRKSYIKLGMHCFKHTEEIGRLKKENNKLKEELNFLKLERRNKNGR